MTEVSVQQETVTFYSWMGTAGRSGEEHSCPSCQVIYISGGTKKLSQDGGKVSEPTKEARFHNGKLTTSDPEVIAGLRRMIKEHPQGLSENIEDFYNATMTPTQRAQRAGTLGQAKDEKIREVSEENSRLRRLLEQQGQGESSKRSKSAA